MKRSTWSLLCASLMVATGLLVSGMSHAAGPCWPAYRPKPQPPQIVERTVNVQVPVRRPLPPRCIAPSPCRVRPNLVKPTAVPVRVQVAVSPERVPPKRMVPIVYHSPGPLKPVVTHAVGLTGSVVAAPFRVADMFLPVYHPGMTLRRQRCAPPRPCRGPAGYPCGPRVMCPPPVRKCAVPPYRPPCPVPMACAPSGPSVCPLPRAACPPPCTPNIPPRMVMDAEFPYVEPRGILAGIVNLPFRVLQRGRLVGDMSQAPSGRPRMR